MVNGIANGKAGEGDPAAKARVNATVGGWDRDGDGHLGPVDHERLVSMAISVVH